MSKPIKVTLSDKGVITRCFVNGFAFVPEYNLAQCREERDIAQLNFEKFRRQWEESEKRIDEYNRSWSRDAVKRLRKRITDLENGLRVYGRHKKGCPASYEQHIVGQSGNCACGLSTTIKNPDAK